MNRIIITVMAILLTTGAAVNADIINASFELPYVGPTGLSNNAIDSWTWESNHDRAGRRVWGIDFTPVQWYHPDGSQYSASGDPSDVQLGNSYDGSPTDTDIVSILSQNLSNTIQADTYYQFSLDMTTRAADLSSAYPAPNVDLILEAWDGVTATTIATHTVSCTSLETNPQYFVTYSTAMTLPDESLIGQQLRVAIQITSQADVQNGKYAVFMDHASIASSSVPEPSTIALLATGLVGLLCYAWRKRK